MRGSCGGSGFMVGWVWFLSRVLFVFLLFHFISHNFSVLKVRYK